MDVHILNWRMLLLEGYVVRGFREKGFLKQQP